MLGFNMSKENARKLFLSAYEGEPCRICGEIITDAGKAVYAGKSADKKSRSAHESCWEENPPKSQWAFPLDEANKEEGMNQKNNERIPLEKEAIRYYLDSAILAWRKRRERGDPFAKYYIDAFQSIRTSLLGEVLPSDGPQSAQPESEKDLYDLATDEQKEQLYDFIDVLPVQFFTDNPAWIRTVKKIAAIIEQIEDTQ